jgi:hypothetical protein
VQTRISAASPCAQPDQNSAALAQDANVLRAMLNLLELRIPENVPSPAQPGRIVTAGSWRVVQEERLGL